MEAKTKIIPVIRIGERTQEAAYSVLYQLKVRMAPGCVPVFSLDGLKHYFCAITVHFGFWQEAEGVQKPQWVLWPSLLYGQVIKRHRCHKLVEVEQRMLCGEKVGYFSRLKAIRLSGMINTSFIERLNLTLRHGVSKLLRRTLGLEQYQSELEDHPYWWLSVYHFVNPHDSLRESLSQLLMKKGKQRPQKYRQQTPVIAAGLTKRRRSVRELLSYPLL